MAKTNKAFDNFVKANPIKSVPITKILPNAVTTSKPKVVKWPKELIPKDSDLD